MVGAVATKSAVGIDEIGTPCCRCPCLLWVPTPIAAPSLLCPEAARKHAEGEKRHAYRHKAVGGWQIVGTMSPKSCHGKEESTAEKTVGEHIDRDMRYKPKALQGWHKRLVVYLWMNDVYHYEYRGNNEREDGNEPVVPTAIDYPARENHKQRVPQTSLAKRAQWRTIKAYP